ncbi:MAG: hypothetical protein K2P50_14680 [Lachnospiraceae bacterium]|nr:hypothetical protein [Lachnospiraceae bacterium]
MKEFKLFSYIRNYKVIIVISSLIMGILFYAYFSGKQTYTASAIIQYKNEQASRGLAADGTEIDVTEIYSAEVMTKVFEKLELNYSENNMDAIRGSVRVEEVQSREEAAVQEALNEKGEVAETKPTMYRVSYTIGSRDARDAEDFSRQILTAMLNAYVETYAENHVNSEIPLYSVDGIYDNDYDYIEMLELLSDAVDRASEQLSYKEDGTFRSADTGYSFSDLQREFSLINNIDLPNAYAYVLGNQITKDQDTLISKYENRIKNAVLKNDASETESVGIEEIIDSYVEMMRGSNNTDFTHEYILGEVYENYYDVGEKRQHIEQTTEYDDLMNNYVQKNTEFEQTLIDIAYDRYILDVFSGSIDEGSSVAVQVMENPEDGGETEAEDEEEEKEEKGEGDAEGKAASFSETTFDTEVVIQKEILSSQESRDEAYRMIKELTDRIDTLYRTAQMTNEEYNRFAGAENIAIMTDTITVPSLNLLVYAMLAVVLFGMIGCVLAVVVGRTLEIFDYYVFTDKKLDIANRAGCDRYIARFEKALLPSDFVCISVKMLEIEQKNKKFGREKCDRMMADFCRTLRDILPSEKAFVANNALGQFVIFLKESDKNQAHAYVQEIGNRCTDYNKENECTISYSCGISESGQSRIYNIRKLMIDSMKKASGINAGNGS